MPHIRRRRPNGPTISSWMSNGMRNCLKNYVASPRSFRSQHTSRLLPPFGAVGISQSLFTPTPLAPTPSLVPASAPRLRAAIQAAIIALTLFLLTYVFEGVYASTLQVYLYSCPTNRTLRLSVISTAQVFSPSSRPTRATTCVAALPFFNSTVIWISDTPFYPYSSQSPSPSTATSPSSAQYTSANSSTLAARTQADGRPQTRSGGTAQESRALSEPAPRGAGSKCLM
ncbi:hypothetical protein C8J57DRAFT_1538244 [Mycena rebaudengoi]|nr:hypothetical protein C8J57DRAFT_1538244 [Mycena rebaudengoi]